MTHNRDINTQPGSLSHFKPNFQDQGNTKGKRTEPTQCQQDKLSTWSSQGSSCTQYKKGRRGSAETRENHQRSPPPSTTNRRRQTKLPPFDYNTKSFGLTEKYVEVTRKIGG
ncbi:hypothetical protein DPMN_009019 [Dreissena polymorpha]|uniref:Uncharacterized protein n=1 Tax=Dreissena polymorpha TaxID=45954 RepID=A0A9D4S084_DREPO|nr:hypothetical protein DPMN_009019 [Dreissena polymorpha]